MQETTEQVYPVRVDSTSQAFVHALALCGWRVRQDDSHNFFLMSPAMTQEYDLWRETHPSYRHVTNLLHTWSVVTYEVCFTERVQDSIIQLTEEELDGFSEWLRNKTCDYSVYMY